MLLHESSCELIATNIHLGLLKPSKLAFGVKSATGVFQKAIEKKLKGLKNTVVRADNILVGGRDEVDLLKILCGVFVVIQGNGLKLNKEKCLFLQYEIFYLGHKINKWGLSSIPEKLDAILNAPTPTNVSELKALLGMLNYFHKFSNKLSAILEPLNYFEKDNHGGVGVLNRKRLTKQWSYKHQLNY